MQISTYELEQMFYKGPEELPKIAEALKEEFEQVEDGDKILRSYITDNITKADELLNVRAGLYGVLTRALEFAEAALDYYENLYLEEIRQAAEKQITENNTDTKKKAPTDSVMKAQAAVKVAPYRRLRNFIRGYVNSCEKSQASLRTSVGKCQTELYLAAKMSYQAPAPNTQS